MTPRLRRLSLSAAVTIALAFAPLAQAAPGEDRGPSLRAAWQALWTWLAPAGPTPRLEAIPLEAGLTIDPLGRGAAPPPAAGAGGDTSNAGLLIDPSG